MPALPALATLDRMTSTATSLPQTRHLATAVPGPRSQALHLEREAQVTTGFLEPRPDLAAAIAKRCHQQGVLTLVCGTHGNVIRLLPPLVIGEALLRDGLAVLRQAILAESPALAGSAAR